MLTLARIIRLLALLGGIVGVIASVWALVDPSIMAATDVGAFAAPSPRWRAAFGLVFSLALLGYGSGVLRHRELP
jgi:hypothetical protein